MYYDFKRTELMTLGFTVLPAYAIDALEYANEVWDIFESNELKNCDKERVTRFEYPGLSKLESQLNKCGIGNLLKELTATRLLQSEINLLKGDSYWHRDGLVVPHNAYRVAMYLDKLEINAGTLSFVPGSHRMQKFWGQEQIAVLANIENENNKKNSNSTEKCAIQIVSYPGDVIIFNSGVMHASFGGGMRRQIAFVYVGDAVTNEDKQALSHFALNRILTGTTLFK